MKLRHMSEVHLTRLGVVERSRKGEGRIKLDPHVSSFVNLRENYIELTIAGLRNTGKRIELELIV